MKRKLYAFSISAMLLTSAVIMVLIFLPTKELANPNKAIKFRGESSSVEVVVAANDDYTNYNDVVSVNNNSYCSIENLSYLSSTCLRTVKVLNHESGFIILNEVQELTNTLTPRKVSYIYIVNNDGATYKKRIESVSGRGNAVASDIYYDGIRIYVSIIEYGYSINEKLISYVKELNMQGNVISNNKIATDFYFGGIKAIGKVGSELVLATYMNQVVQESMILRVDKKYKLISSKTVEYNIGQLNILNNKIYVLDQEIGFVGGYEEVPSGSYPEQTISLNEIINPINNNFIGQNGVVVYSIDKLQVERQTVLSVNDCSYIGGTYKTGSTVSAGHGLVEINKGCYFGSRNVFFDSTIGYVVQQVGLKVFSLNEYKSYEFSGSRIDQGAKLVTVSNGYYAFISDTNVLGSDNIAVVGIHNHLVEESFDDLSVSKTYQINQEIKYTVKRSQLNIYSNRYLIVDGKIYRFNNHFIERLGA